MDALTAFLVAVARIRATRAGTAETSYYPAVNALLDTVGAGLKPKVFALHHISGAAGIPDFGLFVQRPRGRGDAPVWAAGTRPDRGVVEVKPPALAIDRLLETAQVRTQYLPEYGLLLATNLWDWRRVRPDRTEETFRLADDEAGFWLLVHGGRVPEALATRFADFLERCLLADAPLGRPADVARFLASYARDALARLTERAGLPALGTLREGMQAALGVAFEGAAGERLFRSTLVQTLFYGVFSAWVAHTRAGKGVFDWRAAEWSLTVPVVRLLFREVANPEALEPLHLVELMDAAADTLGRVDRAAFFAAFDDTQAVQYFYEPFLQYYDPELRRQMGVWYTPPEIVTYMVERVDRVLRSELGVADGLADPNVWVLDPCCGTGSFLVAVLDRIRRTLEGRGLGDLVGDQLKRAATTRIVGFEIMTAPLVIARWQMGEALRRAERPLQQGERASIYLTNALTGWDESDAGAPIPGFAALVQERADSRRVKQERPILVVIGNPPYNAYAGVSPASEGGLVDAYKVGLRERWGVKKFNLDDLFVRFFRIAERRIERTGRGVVCFISNWSWIFLPSYVVMRERLLAGFGAIWIDSLNGDSRETGKLTPDGSPDPSVFSTSFNREGIRVGTAIGLLVRGSSGEGGALFRQFWGGSKREDVVASLMDGVPAYAALGPRQANGYSLRAMATGAAYQDWPTVAELARVSPFPGLLEKRGGGLTSMDRATLEARMQRYFDKTTTFDALRAIAPVLTQDRARAPARAMREHVLEHHAFDLSNVRRYAFFGFDYRWAYVTEVRPLWNEPRPQLLHILPEARGFLVVRQQAIADPEGVPATFARVLGDDYVLHKHAFFIPIVENLSGAPRPNLSERAAQHLAGVSIAPDADGSALVWHHALATLYSPAYLADNADALRRGFPRIPLPADAEALRASAALGAQLADLLDPDCPVAGVTEGEPRPELRTIAVPSTRPGATRDWRLTGWGSRTDKGITMPGRGRVDARPFAADEAATAAHETLLGNRTADIGLNAATYWRNVPEAVWECRIGGYQVLKKWLSYRDASILDRALTPEEMTHVMHTARRIAAILLLGPALDAAHRACTESHPRQLDAPPPRL